MAGKGSSNRVRLPGLWLVSKRMLRLDFIGGGIKDCWQLRNRTCSMSQRGQTYVAFPQGRARFIGLVSISLPCIFALAWVLQGDESQWHVDGGVRLFFQFVLIPLFVLGLLFFFAHGVFWICFTIIVRVDPMIGQVTQIVRACGVEVRRRAWVLSEFKRIEMRQRYDGDSKTYTSEIGIKHVSGRALWLRAFWSSSPEPDSEAQAFLAELERLTGLKWDGSKLSLGQVP